MTSRQRQYDLRRTEKGWRRVPVWLDRESLDALAKLRAKYPGLSDQELIRAAIQARANP